MTGDPGEDVVFGRNPVQEALRADEDLLELYVAEAAGDGRRDVLGTIAADARRSNVPVHYVPKAALDRMSGGGRHQGVVAKLAGYRYRDLAEIVAAAMRAEEPLFVLVLDEIQDIHNLGSMIRTAEAAGMHGIVIPDRRAAAVTAAVRRASSGAVAHAMVARMDLIDALDRLRERDVRVIGLDAAAQRTAWDVDLTGPLAIVVGSEGSGMRRVVSRRCDAQVRLPMHGEVESLNAAVAGSVLTYEALRQRQAVADGQ